MPPSANEVEITVLGRGYGESVVVHTGDGGWVVVDSFQDDQANEPAPLAYLRSIGVKVEDDVTSVVLTHLHYDHYQGIDEVVEACESAWFYMPGVLPRQRWQEFLSRGSKQPGSRAPRLDQVLRAVNIAFEREQLRLAGVDSEIETRREYSLRCVGPTSAAFAHEILEPNLSETTINKMTARANYTSTVLWVSVHGVTALLGADFDSDDKQLGWEALLGEQENKHWLCGASLVKVPHHGSQSAHHPPMYSTWCDKPIALIAGNWNSGLPDTDTATRLRPHCSEMHHTSVRGEDREQVLPAAPDEHSAKTRTPTGAVTARRQPGSNSWTITHRGPAWREF